MAGDRHRVLLTADSVGGVWQYALELARGLIERGDEIALATMGTTLSRNQRREAAAMPRLALYPSSWKLAWMREPWADVERAGDWLLSVAAQVRPTVVHLNDYSHGALPWDVPVLMVGHSCVLSWWQAVHAAAAPDPEWSRYREVVRRGLHAADRVVSPSRAMLGALQRHYGPLRATQVIHNARSRSQRNELTRCEPLVLAAGRMWDPAKNFDALAAVAPRLAWPVCIAGEPRHPDGSELALPNVRALGQLSSAQLANWFARASIYALPARYEPFGLSALEAAQAGCALVLGDIDSLREVWGEAALFVAPDDHDALSAALQRLIADPALRAEYAARARLRAMRYVPASMVDQYRCAYRELQAGPRASEPVRSSGVAFTAGAGP